MLFSSLSARNITAYKTKKVRLIKSDLHPSEYSNNQILPELKKFLQHIIRIYIGNYCVYARISFTNSPIMANDTKPKKTTISKINITNNDNDTIPQILPARAFLYDTSA